MSGCCGVKKQKLGSSSSGEDGTSSADSHQRSNGFCNGLAKTNGSCRATMKVANKEMVVFCFDVLYHYLHSTDPPKPPKFPNEQFPLFVTWKLGKEKKLRGCIGTFNSTSLHQGLREYAITSACKDSRFDPITADDFSRLHCSISLLLDFEVAEHYLDWEIGIHGIRIEFSSEKGTKKAATYLPEVAVEQGWNQVQTIDSLLRKGGFKGTITQETRNGVCLIRFQSEKVTISYAEYVAYKQGYDVDEPTTNVYQNSTFQMTMTTNGSSPQQNNNSRSSPFRFSTSNGHSSSSYSSGYSSGGGHYRTTNNSDGCGGSGSGRASPNNSGSSSIHRNSHHPSPNASRYLPLPNHPYMPPPSM